jgi:hypothetical protein
MLKFQLMGKFGVDDESDYASAMDDKTPDNELDADFDDGSYGDKKLPSKASSQSPSKVTVNNQEAPLGSALKRPPGQTKTKAAKVAATAAPRSCNLLVATPVADDYLKLVASSAIIEASICYKSRMDVLMREAEMYYHFGEKGKSMEIMAKAEHLHQLEVAKVQKW